MDPLVLGADLTTTPLIAGHAGTVGWVLIAGGILMTHTWLMVYAMFLAQDRGQETLPWMALTFLFGIFAIIGLWLRPRQRTCPSCAAFASVRDRECPMCGYRFRSAHEDAEPVPGLPTELDEDDGLTS